MSRHILPGIVAATKSGITTDLADASVAVADDLKAIAHEVWNSLGTYGKEHYKNKFKNFHASVLAKQEGPGLMEFQQELKKGALQRRINQRHRKRKKSQSPTRPAGAPALIPPPGNIPPHRGSLSFSGWPASFATQSNGQQCAPPNG